MNGFLYFLPGHNGTVKPDEVVRRGLEYALAGESIDPCHNTHGPGDQAGTVAAIGNSVHKLGYYPKEQTWQRIVDQRIPDELRPWVGFWNDRLPGPDDLARREIHKGRDLTLADGRIWHAPAARVWIEEASGMRPSSTLPARISIGEDGKWSRGGVLPQFAELQAIAEAWWDERMEGAQTGSFLVDDAANKATRVLATNYRIGQVEASLLGIWSDSSMVAVLDASIDAQGFMELSKKKAGAGSS